MITTVTRTAAFLIGGLALLVPKPALHATGHTKISVERHSPTANGAVHTIRRSPALAPQYPRIPLYFELNRGQAASETKFVARGLGYSVFLNSTEAVLLMPSASSPVRMKLIGANAEPHVTGVGELPGKVSYMRGAAPASWRSNIPTYARVAYRDLYPGVDLVYRANQHQLEYDFIVAPGADPHAIALRFEGTHDIALTADGDLVLHTTGGTIRQPKPVVYQEVGSARRAIQGEYVLRSPHEVGFALGVYDASRPLVIDPTLAFSSYLGGTGGDRGQRMALDAAGNIYFTGITTSLDSPTANATPLPGGTVDHTDTFVVKVSADGSTLLYATYFGGSGNDDGLDIAVDPAGRVYVSGMTNSADFPTYQAIQPTYGGGPTDAFVVQLDVAGDAFVYSTYLGGSDFERAAGIAVDALGDAFVAGSTGSRNFPTENPFQPRLRGNFDAFVTKLSPTGATLLYSTYLGGVDRGFSDFANGIAVNAAGNAYVVGTAWSRDFPRRHAFQNILSGESDAFVTKFSVDGSKLVYSTFLGGTGPDTGIAIAVDGSDRATIVGHTGSTDFPTAFAIQAQSAGSADVFVAQFDANGTSLRFSTYLGGSAFDFSGSIALDPAANIYITGGTASTDFPLADPIQSVSGSDEDAFVAKISANGARLVYSTYLGGEQYDEGVGIAADSVGNAYVTGYTNSLTFPVINALQPTLTSSNPPAPIFEKPDAFFAKIAP